jgi:glutamate-1-semialdehyde aminotransferase
MAVANVMTAVGNARYARSLAQYRSACEVIPGGGHLSGRPLLDVDNSPLYFERAKGCRIWDVDGNEYIDYLLAFGAHLLGYAHPEVERRAFEQAQSGRLLSLNHPLHERFVRALLERFPGAEMGVFFKTGSEATSAALRIARRCTGRRSVARCGYHGWHDWCLPLEDFVPEALDRQVPEFDANNPATLSAIFAAMPGDIAAVIVAPEMVTPFNPGAFHEIARITRENAAVLIMDEVKTGLRIAPNSVSERVGIEPDLVAVSKAMSSGFPIAALLGKRDVLNFGAGMHYSATFHGETGAMAAALTTLELIETLAVQSHVWQLGEALITGLNDLAARHDLPARAYGEPLPPMPFMRFIHPRAAANARLTEAFYGEMLRRGILLHPRHMWFISHAHSSADIARTLEAADAAFRVASHVLTAPVDGP